MKKLMKFVRKNGLILGIIFVIALVGIPLTSAFITHYTAEGYVKAWPGGILAIDEYSIILGSNCTAIIADTSEERAYAIQKGIEGKMDDRPLTQDTFVTALKSYNITMEAAHLERYDGQYYYAFGTFSNGEKVLKLDMMPSDAIAFALRFDAPIYINATLLEEKGKRVC